MVKNQGQASQLVRTLCLKLKFQQGAPYQKGFHPFVVAFSTIIPIHSHSFPFPFNFHSHSRSHSHSTPSPTPIPVPSPIPTSNLQFKFPFPARPYSYSHSRKHQRNHEGNPPRFVLSADLAKGKSKHLSFNLTLGLDWWFGGWGWFPSTGTRSSNPPSHQSKLPVPTPHQAHKLPAQQFLLHVQSKLCPVQAANRQLHRAGVQCPCSGKPQKRGKPKEKAVA